MQSVNDFGKIWLRGFIRPEFGVRIGEMYFVISEEDSQCTNYFLYKKHLLVVIFHPEKKNRLFRRFSLDLIPKSQGTLFNGFNETKHADIKAVTYRDEGVEEYLGSKEDSFLDIDGEIDPIKIMDLTGWQ